MMDHSAMKSSPIQHAGKQTTGHAMHNHHAMMIADFKKRFYVVLILTIPVMLLSPMIQKFIDVDWQFTVRLIFYLLYQLSYLFMGNAFFKRAGAQQLFLA